MPTTDPTRPSERRSACTTVIVGRKVSADGSRIFGRTEDSEGLAVKQLISTPAEKRDKPWIFEDYTNGFQTELPAESCAYLSVPNAPALREGIYAESVINAYGVSLSATESIYGGAEALAVDPLVKDGVAESNLPTIVMPYVKTAREGVRRLGMLLDRHGSAEGNAVVFADANETWYMEIYSGHQWVAVRFPDDRYAVIANDGMLGYVDEQDKENVIACKTLWSLAKEHGFLKEHNGKPHLALTYCQPHRDYSQLRVWAAHRRFSPSQTGAYNVNETYDMLMKPDAPLSLSDVMELTRYRYEDTEYNVNLHPHLRAIGICRCAEAHVFWLRPDKPEVMWVALANAEMSAYLPVYRNAAAFPDAFTLDCAAYDPSSAYYKFRRLSALGVQNREKYSKPIREHWRGLEQRLIAETDARDARYEQSGRDGNAAAELFAEIAGEALADADRLFDQTLAALMLDTVQDGGSDLLGNAPEKE